MKQMIKNKRADIPVTILLIGVFAICTLAILSFSIIDNKSKEGFTEVIQAMEEINMGIEKYEFYKNPKLELSEEEINDLLGVQNNKIVMIKEIDGEKIIEVEYIIN